MVREECELTCRGTGKGFEAVSVDGRFLIEWMDGIFGFLDLDLDPESLLMIKIHNALFPIRSVVENSFRLPVIAVSSHEECLTILNAVAYASQNDRFVASVLDLTASEFETSVPHHWSSDHVVVALDHDLFAPVGPVLDHQSLVLCEPIAEGLGSQGVVFTGQLE